jgi:hypothetical protein
MRRRFFFCILVSSVMAGTATIAGEKQPSAQAVQFFEAKVRPVLADNCFKCHGADKHKGSLRLDSRPGILAGGDRGPAIAPGEPGKSLLIQAISYVDDLKMPPSKKLPKEQIADLAQWIKMGAPWPGADVSSSIRPTQPGEFRITDKDRAHWAFRPVKRPAVPVVKNSQWPDNPIDTFILAGLEARGLEPNPPAAKVELIRRVWYDLTGLPPTPEDVNSFVADASPQAYETVVDRLLNSPHYGEKWGRHWLDLVRFAETNSYERDDPKPNAWRYRDYVIGSFNDDKPYDRFVREQLAGDELVAGASAGDSVAEALIATGYYRLGIWDDEPTDRDQARFDGLDDIVATTGQVFLGLTFDCARCHDHKIDPIPQKDYYRLLAFFHNINHYRNGGPTDEVALILPPEAMKRHEETEGAPVLKGKRKQKETGPMALCVTEAGSRAPDTFVLVRGNPQVKGDKVEPAFPQVLGGAIPVIQVPSAEAKTARRRLALANWIASADNPLTARVMVNRLWQYHFGRGIVRSPNNYGLQGEKPTHPELLDWLAAEFVSQGWRMKPLHRLIVTSKAYRMSSRGNSKSLSTDPMNDGFWRFDMRRLTGEEIRDSMLAVNGTLNSKMYGPGVYVDIPPEVLAGQSRPGYGWGKSPPPEQARRSVYIHVKRSLLTPILETFDVAETDRSSPVRFVTTQPTQALTMLNSAFLNEQASQLAGRLRRLAGTDLNKQVRWGLRLVTARQPRPTEIERGAALMKALSEREGASVDEALTLYCLVLLNLNEFVYLD